MWSLEFEELKRKLKIQGEIMKSEVYCLSCEKNVIFCFQVVKFYLFLIEKSFQCEMIIPRLEEFLNSLNFTKFIVKVLVPQVIKRQFFSLSFDCFLLFSKVLQLLKFC